MENHVITGRQCIELRLPRGSSIACTQGLLWLTFEPAPRRLPSLDWQLEPGRAHVLPTGGRVFVSSGSANRGACFEVRRAPQVGWLARLRAWCSGAAAPDQPPHATAGNL